MESTKGAAMEEASDRVPRVQPAGCSGAAEAGKRRQREEAAAITRKAAAITRGGGQKSQGWGENPGPSM